MERLAPLPWQSGLWDQLAGWRERLPHAMLLHGGRGIGKRHLAQAFAQLLLQILPPLTVADLGSGEGLVS